ncbi:DUF1337 domain protein [Tricharina praecox]|uniref:DUF1337 domain protein n=1 Tax=Tricharina praecox TaxID=43433 RepID=UPI00221E89BB|nr:DUF1337 domain protein [Tricharina praecox]KAI5854656.1 DUF1337 domain protein [Tricharina praecox]
MSTPSLPAKSPSPASPTRSHSPPPAEAAPPPPAPLTPRDKKLAALTSQNSHLTTTLATLQTTLTTSRAQLRNPALNGEDTVKRHIHLLHEYNEVKDVAMGLLSLVAEARGVAVGVVKKELGVGDGDD